MKHSKLDKSIRSAMRELALAASCYNNIKGWTPDKQREHIAGLRMAATILMEWEHPGRLRGRRLSVLEVLSGVSPDLSAMTYAPGATLVFVERLWPAMKHISPETSRFGTFTAPSLPEHRAYVEALRIQTEVYNIGVRRGLGPESENYNSVAWAHGTEHHTAMRKRSGRVYGAAAIAEAERRKQGHIMLAQDVTQAAGALLIARRHTPLLDLARMRSTNNTLRQAAQYLGLREVQQIEVRGGDVWHIEHVEHDPAGSVVYARPLIGYSAAMRPIGLIPLDYNNVMAAFAVYPDMSGGKTLLAHRLQNSKLEPQFRKARTYTLQELRENARFFEWLRTAAVTWDTRIAPLDGTDDTLDPQTIKRITRTLGLVCETYNPGAPPAERDYIHYEALWDTTAPLSPRTPVILRTLRAAGIETDRSIRAGQGGIKGAAFQTHMEAIEDMVGRIAALWDAQHTQAEYRFNAHYLDIYTSRPDPSRWPIVGD